MATEPADRPHSEHELETIDIDVNVGPQHPATHGVFRMVLTVDGEVVTDVDPVIGYMHRGNEKLPENCDYRQAIGYHDRTDYLAQFNTEHCYVEAVEKLGGMPVPERAQYIRVILAELEPHHQPPHVRGRVRHRRRPLRDVVHVRLPRPRVRSRTSSKRSPASG